MYVCMYVKSLYRCMGVLVRAYHNRNMHDSTEYMVAVLTQLMAAFGVAQNPIEQLFQGRQQLVRHCSQ